MARVYILLTDTGTLFTKSIKSYTGAPYNHASLAFDSQLRELYSFGRKKASNPFYGGFVKEDVFTGTFSKYPKTTCAIYELLVTDRELQKMKRILQLFKKNERKLYYNLLGVIGVSIKEPGLCQPFVGGIFSILIGVSEFRMLGFSSVKNLRAFKSLSSLSVLGKLEYSLFV